MSLRSILVLVVIGLLVLFAALNWTAFTAPTQLSLLVTTIQAPLGLIMLAFVLLLAVALLVFALKLQFAAFVDSRKQTEELRKQRELADQAEASRFTDLRKYLEVEIDQLKLAQKTYAAQIREELTVVTHSLEASIGEIDDRLERQAPTPPALMP